MRRLAILAVLVSGLSASTGGLPAAAEDGRWVSRKQLVLDKASGELVRRQIEVWDATPSSHLEFYWEPDGDDTSAQEGRLQGRGMLTWRRRGSANYDREALVSVYRGEIRDGRMHGQGRLMTRDGATYEGSWRDGALDGSAEIRFENGDEYRGEVKAGTLSGTGRYIAATGELYEGPFLNGKRNGSGQLTPPGGEPRASHWRDGIEVVSASDMTPVQFSSQDDIQIAVTVDARRNAQFRKAADGQEVDPIVYVAKAGTAETLIVPEDDVYKAWKGEGPLYHLSSKYAPIGRNLSGANNYLHPALIRVDVLPRGTATGQLKSLQLEVADSASDLQPFLGIVDGHVDASDCGAGTEASPFDPTFKLINTGWANPVGARFTFAFTDGRGGNRTRTFEQSRAAFKDVTDYSVETEIAALGVDLGQLKAWKFKCPWNLQAEQGKEAPPNILASCQAKALSQLRLGQLKSAAYFVPKTGLLVTTVEGTLRHDWVDVRGARQTSAQRLIVRVLLATVEIEGPGECGYAPEDPKAGVPILELATDRKNYKVSYPLRQLVPITGTGRQFAFGAQAKKSSNHNFRVVAELADGRRIVSQPVRLTYARPRKNPLFPE